MKKNVFVCAIIGILTIGFLFTGCALFGSAPAPEIWQGVTWNVPEEQLCTIEIAGGLKITGFNGTKVSWAENQTASSWRVQRWGSDYKTIVKIPAGKHNLEALLYLWDYSMYPGAEVFAGQRAGYAYVPELKIDYDFQPGCTYFIRPIMTTRKFGAHKGNIVCEKYTGSALIWTEGKSEYMAELPRFIGTAQLRIDENGTPVAHGNTITVSR